MESGRRGHPAEERRQRRRRDDDVAEHTIVENAVHDAPIVNRLVRASDRITKIGGAGIILGGIIGGAAAGLGVRITGPSEAQAVIAARVSTNSARIDSLVRAIDDLRYTVQTMAFVQCVQVRRSYPDLTSADCAPVAPKVTR
jgi:precorrin-4 methylase